MSIIAMPPAICGAAPASGNAALIDIITTLGLTGNLKLCLDAGDADSYNPAVQTAKWLDTSGNGYDFYRGTSGVGDGAEPTFNGSAGGLSGAEYFSFDGGDYFSYDAANEAWMNALHNNGAIFTLFAIVSAGTSGGYNPIIGTGDHNGATPLSSGMVIENRTSDQLAFAVINGTTSVTLVNGDAGDAFDVGVWVPVGMAISENGGASGSHRLSKNGSADFNASNASVNSNTPSTLCIGARGPSGGKIGNGWKIACLAIWQGTALTATNLSDIYDAIKGRFGL